MNLSIEKHSAFNVVSFYIFIDNLTLKRIKANGKSDNKVYIKPGNNLTCQGFSNPAASSQWLFDSDLSDILLNISSNTVFIMPGIKKKKLNILCRSRQLINNTTINLYKNFTLFINGTENSNLLYSGIVFAFVATFFHGGLLIFILWRNYEKFPIWWSKEKSYFILKWHYSSIILLTFFIFLFDMIMFFAVFNVKIGVIFFVINLALCIILFVLCVKKRNINKYNTFFAWLFKKPDIEPSEEENLTGNLPRKWTIEEAARTDNELQGLQEKKSMIESDLNAKLRQQADLCSTNMDDLSIEDIQERDDLQQAIDDLKRLLIETEAELQHKKCKLASLRSKLDNHENSLRKYDSGHCYSPVSYEDCRYGEIQKHWVECGLYEITTAGAHGGDSGDFCGGCGAILVAVHKFDSPCSLEMIIGQSGDNAMEGFGGGGGGGTTCVVVNGDPLQISGAGGGACCEKHGESAVLELTEDSSPGCWASAVSSGPGAGWSDSVPASGDNAEPGHSSLGGWRGGTAVNGGGHGGFGGGGGGSGDSGGGAGGYSGGNGSSHCDLGYSGGSFSIGKSIKWRANTEKNGFVIIQQLTESD